MGLVFMSWFGRKSEKERFPEKLRKKDYKLGLELYTIFLKLSDEFENSVALGEFVKRVEDIPISAPPS